MLPKHWMKKFFDAHAALELQQNTEAVQMYNDFIRSGLKKSSYILSQLALAYYNLKGKEKLTSW